jgi:hypothetical protein
MNAYKHEFVERLLKILGDRKRHVWGTELGFTSNRIHRLFIDTEPFPSTEELGLIGEAENLNLNWLVYGIEPKYRVRSFLDLNQFNNAVEGILAERWARIFMAVCQSRCALLTVRLTQFPYKKRTVNVQQAGCLVGPGSTRLQTIVAPLDIQGVEIPTYRFEELEAGEIGAHFLFGDRRIRGYLEDLEKQDVQRLLGNMPIATFQSEIDLICLINCYNKILSFRKSTGQIVNDKKIAELTWIMYQTEMVEQHSKTKTQLPSSSFEDSANGAV